jgi:hypothetical protein
MVERLKSAPRVLGSHFFSSLLATVTRHGCAAAASFGCIVNGVALAHGLPRVINGPSTCYCARCGHYYQT